MNLVSNAPNTKAKTLAAAQRKLLDNHVPMMLRVVSFLRISCSVLEEKGAYSGLMQQLFQCDDQWLASCVVLPNGLLKSSNPEIQQLLMPVLSLYQTIELPLAA